MTYALDANNVIHLLRDTFAVVARYDDCLVQGAAIIIPPYVDFEIRRGLKLAKRWLHCERCRYFDFSFLFREWICLGHE